MYSLQVLSLVEYGGMQKKTTSCGERSFFGVPLKGGSIGRGLACIRFLSVVPILCLLFCILAVLVPPDYID